MKQNVLKQFKVVLKEAATITGRPMHEVNMAQFLVVSKGRVPSTRIQALGGYSVLKRWATNGKATPTANDEALAALKRLAKYAA